MYYYVNSNILIHHGVKGMKWGVRKDKYDKPGDIIKGGINDTVKNFKDAKKEARTWLGNKTKHYARNDNNTNLPRNDIMAEKMGWRKLSEKESAMHQNNQEDGVTNHKWISPDGHREVVFTGKGKNQKITTDERDIGTYNYYDPQKDPFKHTVYDVMPYIFLGNTADDPTTTVGRIYGSAASFFNQPVSSETETKKKGQKIVHEILMKH